MILIAFLLTICSCEKGDPIITFFNINEDHTISLSQTLSNQGGNLTFAIQTNQELKCDNLVLNHLINQNEESVTLWLNGYDSSKKCSNIPGYVVTQVGLKPFRETLSLKIILRYENAIEKNGKLTVKDGAYSFQLDSDFGIQSKNNSLRLVEQNTYWGQLWSSDEQLLMSQEQVETLINKYGTIDIPQGDYTYFSKSVFENTLHDQSKMKNGITFVGKFTKSNFNQFINEINSINKAKYKIRSFDDKYASN